MGRYALLFLLIAASTPRADQGTQTLYTYVANYRRPIDEKRPLSSLWRAGNIEFQIVVLPDQTFWIKVDPFRYMTSISPVDQRPYFFDLKLGTRTLIDRSKEAPSELVYVKTQNKLIQYLAGQKHAARPIEMFFGYQFETEGFPVQLSRLLGIPEMPERSEVLEFFSRYTHKAAPLSKIGFKSKAVGVFFKDDASELWKYPVVSGTCADYACGQHHKGAPRETTFKPKPEDII